MLNPVDMRDCVLYGCYYYLKVISFSLCNFGSPRYSSLWFLELKVFPPVKILFLFLTVELGSPLGDIVALQPRDFVTRHLPLP